MYYSSFFSLLEVHFGFDYFYSSFQWKCSYGFQWHLLIKVINLKGKINCSFKLQKKLLGGNSQSFIIKHVINNYCSVEGMMEVLVSFQAIITILIMD